MWELVHSLVADQDTLDRIQVHVSLAALQTRAMHLLDMAFDPDKRMERLVVSVFKATLFKNNVSVFNVLKLLDRLLDDVEDRSFELTLC